MTAGEPGARVRPSVPTERQPRVLGHVLGTPGGLVLARDVELALKDGYSTGNSLGVGLPGARRLMDDFELQSKLGVGTTVTAKKWLR